MNWRMGFAAAAIAGTLCAALAWRTTQATYVVGFWYDEFPFTFSDGITAALGGPMTESEIADIKRISVEEFTHALAGLNITVTDSRDAFWTVRVRQSLERRRRQPLPNAGETFMMGPLGSRSAVHFTEVVMAAMAHAPPGAARRMIIEGIGRGTGRTAIHELAHAIVGVNGSMDNRTDPQSYEYFTHNRPSQYYGELRWAEAWPLLVDRVGATRRTRSTAIAGT
jgi:hypothetical protein